jgi:hypothetical protein
VYSLLIPVTLHWEKHLPISPFHTEEKTWLDSGEERISCLYQESNPKLSSTCPRTELPGSPKYDTKFLIKKRTERIRMRMIFRKRYYINILNS